ncbi:MAG TPA: prepilin peptidase [Candidatus Dormibacteraeota bacterium]|nr:prepilin peptidase [Candidatus Dormibacteraeota bacterium]
MNPNLLAALWAVLGAAAGFGVRQASVKLATMEGLEPGHKRWQELGPPILAALVFALYALEIPSLPLLVVRSVFALVLVQVIFFDFEHHLILDRVMFPSMALALLISVFGNRVGLWGEEWWTGIVMGLAAGLIFLVIAVAGAAIFRAEAMGFGDVKLATFLGLLLGWPYIFTALFWGVVLAAVGAVVFIVWHRSMKGTIAYGPYLALGALIMLFQLP